MCVFCHCMTHILLAKLTTNYIKTTKLITVLVNDSNSALFTKNLKLKLAKLCTYIKITCFFLLNVIKIIIMLFSSKFLPNKKNSFKTKEYEHKITFIIDKTFHLIKATEYNIFKCSELHSVWINFYITYLAWSIVSSHVEPRFRYD